MLLEFVLLPLPAIIFLAKIVEWTGTYITLFFLFATGLSKLAILYLYPIVIMPLFASYVDLPGDLELSAKILQLAERVKYKSTRIVVEETYD